MLIEKCRITIRPVFTTIQSKIGEERIAATLRSSASTPPTSRTRVSAAPRVIVALEPTTGWSAYTTETNTRQSFAWRTLTKFSSANMAISAHLHTQLVTSRYDSCTCWTGATQTSTYFSSKRSGAPLTRSTTRPSAFTPTTTRTSVGGLTFFTTR